MKMYRTDDAVLTALSLEESVILKIEMSNLLRRVCITINEWQPEGNDEFGKVSRLTCEAVREFLLINSERVWQGPEANWGSNEFAMVSREKVDGGYRIQFFWENDSRLVSITCAHLKYELVAYPPELDRMKLDSDPMP